MKTLDELGKLVNDVLMNDDTEHAMRIREINTTLHEAAMRETGVRASQLADENMEDSPIVRLYWMTLSSLYAKVLMSAASTQHYSQELKG
jgi:hypothetical protein